MPIPAIALGLAKLVLPWAGEKLFGPDGEKVAEKAVEVAKVVTGTDDMKAAEEALRADPALLLEAQRAAMQEVIQLEAQNTQRLADINATIRAEIASGDAYVRRARPTIVYQIGTAFFVQIIGMTLIAGVAAVFQPERAGEILEGLARVVGATIPLYGVALPVAGVYISKRSRDKEVASGLDPSPGLLDRVLGSVKRAG